MKTSFSASRTPSYLLPSLRELLLILSRTMPLQSSLEVLVVGLSLVSTCISSSARVKRVDTNGTERQTDSSIVDSSLPHSVTEQKKAYQSGTTKRYVGPRRPLHHTRLDCFPWRHRMPPSQSRCPSHSGSMLRACRGVCSVSHSVTSGSKLRLSTKICQCCLLLHRCHVLRKGRSPIKVKWAILFSLPAMHAQWWLEDTLYSNCICVWLLVAFFSCST